MKLVSTLALAHLGAASIHNMENMAKFWNTEFCFDKYNEVDWKGDILKVDFYQNLLFRNFV